MESFALLLLGMILFVVFYEGKRKKIKYQDSLFLNKSEFRVSQHLLKYCTLISGHVLSHITLKLDGGDTTQIDHILVCKLGVIVIETKDYSGWIFAGTRHKEWTQVKYKKKSKFQNPLMQNYKHTEAVKALLDNCDAKYVKSLIVFTRRCEFKSELPAGVIFEDQLKEHLMDMSDENLCQEDIERIVGRLECNRLQICKVVDALHIENLMDRGYR